LRRCRASRIFVPISVHFENLEGSKNPLRIQRENMQKASTTW
jgi:hypothetical protein